MKKVAGMFPDEILAARNGQKLLLYSMLYKKLEEQDNFNY